MDNISKILDAIKQDGQAEADKILAASKNNAEGIMKLYREEAAASEVNILKKAEKEAGEITQRAVSQAGIESRNIKLTARRNSLEKAFVLAREKLTQLPKEEKIQIYAKLLGKYSGAKAVKVILNPEDKQALGKDLVAEAGSKYDIKVSLAETTGDFTGGLVIEEDDVETNCTFEVLVNDIKKERSSEIAAMLFA